MVKLTQALFAVLVSEACHISMSTQVALKWFHIPLTSRQPTIIPHMTWLMNKW